METDISSPNDPRESRTACGGMLPDPLGYPWAPFAGQRVYFCTRACLRAFEAEPERFMAGEIEHPIDEPEDGHA